MPKEKYDIGAVYDEVFRRMTDDALEFYISDCKNNTFSEFMGKWVKKFPKKSFFKS